MTFAGSSDHGIDAVMQDLRAQGAPFAVATVVRTIGATAAKPGAKAVLGFDGEIRQGWIGGGCVRAALAKAARRAMDEGAPQLISLRPQEVLETLGVAAGDDVDGVLFARNGCPSKGSMDIFVEPILPLPELVIFGTSPVAQALGALVARFDWSLRQMDGVAAIGPPAAGARRMVVVATQGKDDVASLRAALEADAEYIAFVGSRRKFATLSAKLVDAGVPAERVAQVHAPAGLAIDAVTPDEIALSILAQLVQIRRRHQRGKEAPDA